MRKMNIIVSRAVSLASIADSEARFGGQFSCNYVLCCSISAILFINFSLFCHFELVIRPYRRHFCLQILQNGKIWPLCNLRRKGRSSPSSSFLPSSSLRSCLLLLRRGHGDQSRLRNAEFGRSLLFGRGAANAAFTVAPDLIKS